MTVRSEFVRKVDADGCQTCLWFTQASSPRTEGTLSDKGRSIEPGPASVHKIDAGTCTTLDLRSTTWRTTSASRTCSAAPSSIRTGTRSARSVRSTLDDATGQPNWVTVNTGLFGGNETFIPLDEATQDGDDLRVPYTKAFIKDAPNLDADSHVDESQEDELYRYYGLQAGGTERVRDAPPER